MNILSREYKGTVYALLSGFLYGFLGYLGMSIIDAKLSVTTMLFWRFFVATLMIGGFMMVQKESSADNPLDLLKILIYGIIFYGPSSIVYFFASKYIGTGLSMVIFFTYPAVVMLLNYLLWNIQITKAYYLALPIIILGMTLLVDTSTFTFNIIGIGLSVLSAIFYGSYIVMSKKSPTSPLASTLMVSVGCMITCFIACLADGSFAMPASLGVWITIIEFGLICTALPIVLLLQALKYISAEKASLLSVLEPVFVVIFGVILLGETINTTQMIGVATVLCGALITLVADNITKHA